MALPIAQVKESARKLDLLNLDPTVKVDLLLVLAGVKPCTDWHQEAAFYHEGQQPDTRDRDRFDKLAEWMNATGLPYEVYDEHIDTQARRFDRASGEPHGDLYISKYRTADGAPVTTEQDRLTILVAKDPAWLEKLKQAHESHDDNQLGECFGFPATARQAFGTADMITPDDVEAPMKAKAFAWYMLSQDNWQAELDTALHWGEAVRKFAPDLYAQIIERQRAKESG